MRKNTEFKNYRLVCVKEGVVNLPKITRFCVIPLFDRGKPFFLGENKVIYISQRILEYKKQARKCWHIWFAWYPVTVKSYPDGADKIIWMQTVLRRGTYELLGLVGCGGWVYEYKEKNK